MSRAPLLLVLVAFAALAIGADSCNTNTSSDLGGLGKKHAKQEKPSHSGPGASKAQASSASGQGSNCDPNYTGACLDPNASDYDCAGGSGNGPDYTGYVRVVGTDHYGLDANGDGIGCE